MNQQIIGYMFLTLGLFLGLIIIIIKTKQRKKEIEKEKMFLPLFNFLKSIPNKGYEISRYVEIIENIYNIILANKYYRYKNCTGTEKQIIAKLIQHDLLMQHAFDSSLLILSIKGQELIPKFIEYTEKYDIEFLRSGTWLKRK